MPPDTRRKLRALMIIAMLAVAEGRRVKTNMLFRDAFNSLSAPSNHGVGKRNGRQASEALDAATEAPLDLDMLFKDPAFHKQLEAMAGHLETFAQAEEMTKEMKAMIADRKFQEQAQLQVNQSSGQESGKNPIRKLLVALMMMMSPGLAYNPGLGAKGRAPFLPSIGSGRLPALGSLAAARGPWPRRRIVAMAGVDRDLGPSMEDVEDLAALGDAPKPVMGSPLEDREDVRRAEDMLMGKSTAPSVRTVAAGEDLAVSGEAPALQRPAQMAPLSPAEQPALPLASAAPSLTSRINQVSTFASLLCAIDCTVLPLLLVFLPVAGGSEKLHEASHLLAKYFALPVGGTALTANFVQHRKPLLGLWGLSGLLLILIANVHLQPGLLPAAFAHILHKKHELVNVLGCALLLSSQRASQKALQAMGKTCGDPNCAQHDGQGLRSTGRKTSEAVKAVARALKSLAKALKPG